MLGFGLAVSASWLAWLQTAKRTNAAENTLNFLHGLKAAIQVAIQGENQQVILAQIHDQMERLQPSISAAEIAAHRRWKSAGGLATIAAISVVAGLCLTLCAVNLWPHGKIVQHCLP